MIFVLPERVVRELNDASEVIRSMKESVGSVLKKGAILASRSIPLGGLVRLANTEPLIIYYHVVSDEDLPHIKHLYSYKSCGEFEADLDYLLKTYVPVNLDDLLFAIRSQKQLPYNAFFLTFDDGLREVADVVSPLLERKGIPAAFFIPSAFLDNKALFYRFKASLIAEKAPGTTARSVEMAVRQLFKGRGLPFTDLSSSVLELDYGHRQLLDDIAGLCDIDFDEFLMRQKPYLTSEQVRGLVAKGFHVGGHSIDHPLFRSLSVDEQLHQTSGSISHLMTAFDITYRIFSFPFSSEGVPEEYFRRVEETSPVDLFFGTGGFGSDVKKRMFHRVPFDGTTPHSLKKRYLEYLSGKLLGRRPERVDP